jgi:hypothetical protein
MRKDEEADSSSWWFASVDANFVQDVLPDVVSGGVYAGNHEVAV